MNAKWLKSKLTSAFSLIELMVVIAIVALLTAIAVPSYQGYLQQSKVTEIFSLASDQMNQWEQQYNAGAVAGVDVIGPAEGTYVASTEQFVSGTTYTSATSSNCTAGAVNTTINGVVCIQLNAAVGGNSLIDPSLDGITLVFQPTATPTSQVSGDITNVNISWACTYAGRSAGTQATAENLLSPGGCTGN